MKDIRITVLLFILFSFSVDGYGQLWKQYADSAKLYTNQKNIDNAIEFYLKAKVELQKDSAGTQTYAQICYGLGICFSQKNQYDQAEKLYLEAKQIQDKVLGREYRGYSATCNSLANIYVSKGQYGKAELLYLEVKQIWEKELGKENPDYANACNSLAVLYSRMGLFEKAEPLFLETKQIREKISGKESSGYTDVCYNLAGLYKFSGQYEKAEPLLIEVKHIEEKVLGKENPDYATTCDGLAILYTSMGLYEKAEPLLLEAKQIQEKSVGKEHPDYVFTIGGLADLYNATGQYEKAEPLYLEARQIFGKTLGRENPDYAGSCNDLANLYMDMGQYEKAKPLYLEAKQIQEKTVGKENPDYATSCNNLALLYEDIGQYEKAKPLYLEAKRIQEKTVGKENPDYATSCNNLANLDMEMRRYEKAKPLYLEAKQIWKKTEGKKTPSYATSCNNLAVLYVNMRQYVKAEPLALEAKQIQETVLGKEHPDYEYSCNNLGLLYWAMHKPLRAEKEFTESFSVNAYNLFSVFQFTNEKEQTAFIKNILGEDNNTYSFYVSSGLKPEQLYALSLFHRNLILSSSQALRKQLFFSNDTSLINKYNAWQDTKKYLAVLYSKPINERKDAPGLEEKADQQEKELSRLSSAFEKQQQRVRWKDIQNKLKADEASIEFASFQFYNGRRLTDSIYYIALVLRKDKPKAALVRLFEKKQLDKLLNSTKNLAIEDRINMLYSNNKALYNLTWKPLEEYLHGIKKVYFASAGNLFKISFAALPVNNKQALGDRYQLIQLNTTASISENYESFIAIGDKIQLYGGIQYNADSAALKHAASTYRDTDASSHSLPDDLRKGTGVKDLPGTRQEVEGIKIEADNAHMQVTILSGVNATEESLKALNGKASPSVLHIASHGFFFPDPKLSKLDIFQQKFEKTNVFRQSDNPLFRSGLLFAGANNAWQGKPVEGIEDGILTAYEVSDLYLPNTKLVVLSACETALGDIQGSEGVYGLQRAFKLAGVQNLVMSLWTVPDVETAEFMNLFYKNLFAGQSIQNAFLNTQEAMMNKYRSEPYKWAAWVLIR